MTNSLSVGTGVSTDTAKDGLLRLQSDGKVLKKDLDRYARLARLEKLAEKYGDDVDDIPVQKINAKLKKLREQVKDLQLDMKLPKRSVLKRPQSNWN